jgi:salicylate biosynthesis isochorismate synthase
MSATTLEPAARARLDHFLARPAQPGTIRQLTLPAPAGEPERLLELEHDGPEAFFEVPDGPTFVALGSVALVRGTGLGRTPEIQAAADALWPRIEAEVDDDGSDPPPRLFGGFSFLPSAPASEWAEFGEAAFFLPRLLYERTGDVARLTVTLENAALEAEAADAVVARIEAVFNALAASAPGGAITEPALESDESISAEDWTRVVASIQERIAGGRVEKVVAARARQLRFRSPPTPAGVLRRLAAGGARSRFAFRLDHATFLGASPERLVSRRGTEVLTEALAGSTNADRAGSADRADELRSSDKDLAEHGFVVRAIVDALAPVCNRLDYPELPEVQRLPHVLHLRTPFAGTLARDVPVLELVARLHPTPAVGGTPMPEALDWIAGEEGLDRGWYAAPVGWFDARGDGDFLVALRSALLAGDRALLYAGAGIVRDSDAAAELAETDVKLRTMLDALGVER